MATKTTRGAVITFALLKTALDWSLRLIPAIGAVIIFVVQLYMAQDRVQDRSKRNEDRITRLETLVNEMRRDLTDTMATEKALKQQIDDNEKFYVLTHK